MPFFVGNLQGFPLGDSVATGILGGSFNPPHYGHLGLAEAALASGRVERIVFIPAAVPPHKAAPSQADPATRLAMTNLLAAGDPRLSVDGIELERSGPSYSVDTLRALQTRHPGVSYRLIIGSDMAKIFAQWREYRILLRDAPPLVAERPDAKFAGEKTEEMFPGLTGEEAAILAEGRFAMRPTPINSTLIRNRIAAGAGKEELLGYMPRAILDFIRRRRLYAMAETGSPSVP